MIIYQAQKSEFLHDVHHRDIEEVILDAFRARTGHKVSPEEIKAWANSLTPMGWVMMGKAVAYLIPSLEFGCAGLTNC